MWKEIAQAMRKYGYVGVDEDMLDRKMRNMRRSYKMIKENNNRSSTGRGRVCWQYYDIFEDIFCDDRTINHSSTLQSTLSNTSTYVSIQSSQQEIQNEADPIESIIPNTDDPVNSLIDVTPSTSSLSDNNNCQPTISNCATSSLASPSSTQSESSTSVPTKTRRTTIYHLRKKQIEMEERRTEALMVLKDSLNETNRILQEKNDLLKEFLLSQTNQSKN